MYYCLHCLTGYEDSVSHEIERLFRLGGFRDALVWFPKKVCRIRGNGKPREEHRPLYPGYLFISFDEDDELFPFFDIRRLKNVIRFLSYSDGTCYLRGGDLSVARWIHRFDGDIAISKVVYKPGEKLKIIDGPMQGMDGLVKKVDRHHKKIWIDFGLDGLLGNVSFDVDFLDGGGASKVLTE
ncbi:MAG: transcription termination/antitermination NusG family protein [Sphaerochaetaceae bacterium]|jgi:transcription termination/antitermination protein NusG|nr:transcription termination/antitermination NusG family protein [Sphaerochaetaceae bacterium]NLY06898.1 hypothetical protein [Spirochaetales bacterium]